MCKPFSGIITKNNKGYYDNKEMSHSVVVEMFRSEDSDLMDDKLPPENTFAKFEITPDNGNLLLPDKWSFNLDEDVTPKWWKKRHEETAWVLHEAWLKWLYSIVDVSKYPKNPLLMKPEPFEKLESIWGSIWGSIGDSIGESIRESIWDSIRGSIWGSIGDSIRGSIWDSIRGSIWGSIGESIWGSIGESIWGSIGGSIWINIVYMMPEVWEKYKQCQPMVDLWHKGIVPVWYQNAWHYYGSPNGDGKAVELFPIN